LRRSSAIAAILAILALPVAVRADSQVDPHASSPAGAVYEIPLETARREGSPHRKSSGSDSQQQSNQSQGSGSGGGGGSTGGGGGAGGGGVLPQGSAVKSENGFGSSSKVPGLASKANTASTQADATPAAKASSSQEPAAPLARSLSEQRDAVPSASASYGLLMIIVLGGAAGGFAAATALRRTLGQPR
jgi:hypothetical protein